MIMSVAELLIVLKLGVSITKFRLHADFNKILFCRFKETCFWNSIKIVQENFNATPEAYFDKIKTMKTCLIPLGILEKIRTCLEKLMID